MDREFGHRSNSESETARDEAASDTFDEYVEWLKVEEPVEFGDDYYHENSVLLVDYDYYDS